MVKLKSLKRWADSLKHYKGWSTCFGNKEHAIQDS